MNKYNYEEINIGQKVSFKTEITEDNMKAFQLITGDINPLHSDSEYAKEKGHKGRVAYGMLTASFLSTLAGVYLPGEKSLIQGMDLKFNKPVYINDVLTIEGEVTEKHDVFRRITVKALVTNQLGEKVLKATIKIGVS